MKKTTPILIALFTVVSPTLSHGQTNTWNNSTVSTTTQGDVTVDSAHFLTTGYYSRFWTTALDFSEIPYSAYGPTLTYNVRHDGNDWESIGGGMGAAFTISEGRLAFANTDSLSAGGVPVNWNDRFTIQQNGNVGIGTANPQAKLQIGSWNLIKDGTWAPPSTPGTDSVGERIVFYQDLGWKTAIGMGDQNGIWFQAHTPGGQVAYQWFTGNGSTAPAEKMRIMDNGKVGIGTTNPQSELSVNGTIQAKEVIVETGWSDFVFEDSYRLRTLE